MKKILILTSLVLILTNCTNQAKEDKINIENWLYNQVLEESDFNKTLVKNHLLLSNLILNDSQITSLKKTMTNSKVDSLTYLFLNYQLWIQTQELKYRDDFIDYYPVNDKLVLLNNTIDNCDYRTVVSPLQNTLAYFAIESREALIKMIKSIKYLDGANADELDYHLQDIYRRNESQFIDILNQLGIEINEVLKFN